MRRFFPGAAASAFLAGFVLILFYRLLFTDRVLASGDILHYFYPYRDYAAAALRAGRLPLWNPYIFMGAPFLANPQTAVLYPLHWPLSWLSVTKQLYWSAALHAWILALGGYALLRRWGASWVASVTCGVLLAGSGFYGGLLGHINQMNGAAWLPWMLWAGGRWQVAGGRWQVAGGRWQVAGSRQQAAGSRRQTAGNTHHASRSLAPSAAEGTQHTALHLLPFSLFVALSILAGHTQTTYINLFGVGVWIAVREGVGIGHWVLGSRDWGVGTGGWGLGTGMRALRSLIPNIQSPISNIQYLIYSLAVYVFGILLGVLISAAQLLPTLELSGLGLRSGGLSYWDVTSFSLRPLLLHWTLLPSYGLRDLSVVFATLGYTEFVAYVGLLGLLLALVGFWRGRGSQAWLCGILLVALGLFLALGRWNPFSLLFYRYVPGFDLFRTPARWMMLYTVGMAVLAGLGIDGIRNLRLLSGIPARPSPISTLRYLVLLALSIELIFAAQALPHTHPTAPQAVYDVRTAPAHLLTEPARALHPAAMGRFLSMSAITFDPGDMSDWRRILRDASRPQLDEKAFTEFVIALKSQEILAPNLPLLWRIPAVDGFDGGVLPLGRYNTFLSLLIPPDELVPDGRVREQLKLVPSAAALALMDARFVITDKVKDLWFQGVYYDRQIGATLDPDGVTTLTVENPHNFQATAMDLIGFAHGPLPSRNQAAATVTARYDGQETLIGSLLVGSQPGAQFADGQLDSAAGEQAGATVAYRDVEGGRQEYLARLLLPTPARLDSLTLALTDPALNGLTIQAVTLVDERTDTFVPLLPSDQGQFRRVHSGDVKIYEQVGGPGRVQLFGAVQAVDAAESAVTALQGLLASDGDSRETAIVEAPQATVDGWQLPKEELNSGEARLLSYEPERVVVATHSEEPAFLVLKDAFYPGWQATVSGRASEIYPANGLFRGVFVPAGDHEIVFSYRPDSWRTGVWISMAAGIVWLLLAGWVLLTRSRERASYANVSKGSPT